MPVISTLRRLRQEDHEFKASLGYKRLQASLCYIAGRLQNRKRKGRKGGRKEEKERIKKKRAIPFIDFIHKNSWYISPWSKMIVYVIATFNSHSNNCYSTTYIEKE